MPQLRFNAPYKLHPPVYETRTVVVVDPDHGKEVFAKRVFVYAIYVASYDGKHFFRGRPNNVEQARDTYFALPDTTSIHFDPEDSH